MNLFIVADWGQTRYVAKSPQYYETNPILGEKPSVSKVNKYFIGVLAVNNGIMIALPDKYKPYYAGVVTTVEAGYVAHNNSIGIKISF